MNANRKILEYTKTDHFLYRQWQRRIDERTLRLILIRVQRILRDQTNLIATTETMKKLENLGLYTPAYISKIY